MPPRCRGTRDVVEVAPAYDAAEIATLAAATVVFDIVTLLVNCRAVKESL